MTKLYTAQVCPFAHRCRLALRLAGVEHQRVEISLREMPAWYLEISPNAKVPLLEVDGKLIWESAIINEYLAEAYPDASLMPADAFAKSRVRLAVDLAGNKFIPAFYKVLQGDKPACDLVAVWSELETSMAADGPYWLGARPTLADLDIYPWFERFCVLEHYRQVARPTGRLGAWIHAMSEHPAVQQETSDHEGYIRDYARYALASAK